MKQIDETFDVTIPPPHHFKASSLGGGLTIEPCETYPCTVSHAGATDCGAMACPECGMSGATLSVQEDEWSETRQAVCRNCGRAFAYQPGLG